MTTANKKEKTKEEREAEVIPKISEAVKLGLSVIESAFEKLDITHGNSDSEEEDEEGERFKPEPLLEAKVSVVCNKIFDSFYKVIF